MFKSILSEVAGTLSVSSALICLLTAIILGIVMAFVYIKTGKYNKNFVISIAILPLLVQVIIMMVNGNLGTSVAVLGAFSLVRFRSVPGNSRDIVSIFFAMAVGLALGMGHIVFATVITVVVSTILFVLYKSKFGSVNENERRLKIVIPENLDYTNIFDEIFEKYLNKYSLEKVKTTNMGSMYELTYNVVLKDRLQEKDFIDAIRIRNGNLNIILGRELESSEL